MPVRALRGATTLDVDAPDHIRERVKALMAALFERNGLDNDQVISVWSRARPTSRRSTPSPRPASSGWTTCRCSAPRSWRSTGTLPRCVRVLLHVETDRPRSELRHVFLEGATVLRPDLPDD